MAMNRVDAVWIAAALETYEVCNSGTEWGLDDICFQQAKIIEGASKLYGGKVPATMASQQCCAYTPYTNYKYLVSNGKKRRISYTGEFHGNKERPQLDGDMIFETKRGNVSGKELLDFIDNGFTKQMIDKENEQYGVYDVNVIVQHIKTYYGQHFISPEAAGEERAKMQELEASGKGAKAMLTDMANEILSFMPRYETVKVSEWLKEDLSAADSIRAEFRRKGKEHWSANMTVAVEMEGNECLLVVRAETEGRGFASGDPEEEKALTSRALRQQDIHTMSGRDIMKFIAESMDQLESYYDSVVREDDITSVKRTIPDREQEMKVVKDKIQFAHNMILYGPPGTGKTYNTAVYAVAICDGLSVEEVGKAPYTETLERYDALRKEKRIAFTTFHQSYGYEEFIEGIRPVIVETGDSGDGARDVQYRYSDGIFKQFCKNAGQVKVQASSVSIRENPRVWNVLLDGAGISDLKKRCFENNYIKIAWADCDTVITEQTKNLNTQSRKILLNFQDEMEVGDIVFIQRSNTTIDGIGVITGDCVFDEDDKEFPRTRTVRWIQTDQVENVKGINQNKQLDRKSVYELKHMDIQDVMALVEKYSQNMKIQIQTNHEPYVFIIDEINRGNISKIFGELITLIEDTKRLGAKEEMKAILPYTKKEFGVPDNVYILGTMNTADRSIALMDTALRRRFKFIEMMPDAEVLREIGADKIQDGGGTLDVALMLDIINTRIEYLLDREHTIGHAFFTPLKDEPKLSKLADIFKRSVIPLLQEYFYEDYGKIQVILGDNGKSDNAYKFILDEPIVPREIFNGNPDIELPEKRFRMQEPAFDLLESYREISRK